MEVMRSLLALLLVAGLASGKHEMYKGYRVHGYELSDETQARAFHEYAQLSDADVWSHAAPGLRTGAVMVAAGAEQAEDFEQAMDAAGIRHWLEVDDVMELLEDHDARRVRATALRNNHVLPFQDYPRYSEIDAYMVEVAQNHPDLVEVVSAGPSFEGRDIKYLRISSTNFAAEANKPVVMIDAMIHAREWVTTPVTIVAIHRLVVELLDQDRDLLDDMDWIIMPLVNPDGYEYTHTDNRLWRKTRSTTHTNGTECPGVDGNRNFDFAFATLGVSANPCSNTYPGESANSEPEVRYVRDLLLQYLDRMELYITIHSSGNYVLFGYGDRSLPANAVQLHHVGAAMGTVMDSVKLDEAGYYLVANSALALYETSGTSQDYAQALGVPFSYTYELPGYGVGHVVPPEYMEHVALETWEGVKAGARLAAVYYRARIASAAATTD